MNNVALTTTDNPWNPITNFDEWYDWDASKGYGTCEYLARVAFVSLDLPDSANDVIINEAIDEIVRKDLIALVTDGGVHYKKVEYSTPD